jgi:hypothetical protein
MTPRSGLERPSSAISSELADEGVRHRGASARRESLHRDRMRPGITIP